MSGENARFGGWRNWETYHLVMMLDDSEWVSDLLDDFKRDGIPASEWTHLLAGAIEERLYDQWYDLKKHGKLILVLTKNPHGPGVDIDYTGIARRYVSARMDADFETDVARSCNRKSPQSSNRKPRTTTGKAPAKKPTQRRR